MMGVQSYPLSEPGRLDSREHLAEHRQMAMLSGPRQVGKTTSAREGVGDHRYYTWDRQSDRMLITAGPDSVADDMEIDTLSDRLYHVVFDELRKYRHWKDFLKGVFDVNAEDTRIVVTGRS